METKYFQKWLSSKLELAALLVEEKGEEAEPDSQILLCCAISAFAAVLWPGIGLDRQRSPTTTPPDRHPTTRTR